MKIMRETDPGEEETARMKRAKRALDTRGKSSEPSFLRPHKVQKQDLIAVDEEDGPVQVNVQSTVYRPPWGFRKMDSVVGSTKHSMDWSLNSITPVDYKDFVTGGNMLENEYLGAQALASVCFSF